MGHTDLSLLLANAAGQHLLSTIEEMPRLWERGHDMTNAVRCDRPAETRFNRLGVHWFYLTLGIGGQVRIPANAGDFRPMDHRLFDALRSMPERNRFMKGHCAWVGFRFGLVLAFLAFGYGVWVIFEALLLGGSVPGWPTIVASIMFFSGVQLLFIGVLGEYQARIFDEVKGRPNYIVARVLRRVRP